jgi:hypothetical protein
VTTLRRAAVLGAIVVTSCLTAAGTFITPSAASAASGAVPTQTTTVIGGHFPVTAATRAAIAASVPSVPTWSRTAFVDGKPYQFKMVGKNPFVAEPNPVTTITTQIIPIVVTFTGSGNTYDPTAPDPTCIGGASALTRTLESPIFATHSYSIGGTTLGRGQLVDEFQRANFWQYTKPSGINPGYHVNLAPKVEPAVSLSFTGTEVTSTCGRVGIVDEASFDAALLSHIADFAADGVTSKSFPLFLLSNIVLNQGTDCCVLGFHAAIPNPHDGGLQTFAVAEFDSSKHFSGDDDIAIVTHEIGEWMDDPTVANPTPPWGGTGQVRTGCQSNLEVGDPLTGTPFAVPMPNGVTYHPQDLAFYSWFYRNSKSIGINGWYSFVGTFRSPAPPCPLPPG